MLISNDYYPALSRENVDVVTDGIAEVRPNAVVTRDGTVREVDAIVVATGFHVTDSPTFEKIHGRDGRTLAQTFADGGQQAYKGTTIANFPNMFFLVGPNTGLGHSSMVYMIESQIAYVADAIATMRRRGLRTVEVRELEAASLQSRPAGQAGGQRMDDRRLRELVSRRARQQHHPVARLHLRVPQADKEIRCGRVRDHGAGGAMS